MKIVFFGSDDFANVHLEALIASHYDVVATVTQPDRPKGRGMKVILSPIKETALKNNIDVLQPTAFDDDVIFKLASYKADYFIVIAYGRILPKAVLDIPKKHSINVHGSLLPKYRGAAPINWAVINGDDLTGLTVMLMDIKMDAGDILTQKEIPIKLSDTANDIRNQMMLKGPSFLIESLDQVSNDKVKPQEQNEADVTYAKKMSKQLARIDWNKPAVNVLNLVRGLSPWSNAFTVYKNKQLKILSAHIVEAVIKCPGEVVEVLKDSFIVSTVDGNLNIENVHLENSKPMSVDSFLRGHDLKVGDRFE
ncbi:MAG: methionyl-tRNA formyltransferase [Candidatus Omnitrophota bacterium]|jgi:methionyl-tRNA formyltransferase